MKYSLRLITAYLLLIPFVFVNLSGTAFAVLTDGPNAVDGLGQISGGEMVYTTKTSGLDNQSFNGPVATLIDEANNRLFVADSNNNRVLVFNTDSNHLFAGTDRTADYVLGQPDFTTSVSGTTLAKLDHPDGLAYDSAGDRLFVADTTNHRIVVYDVSTISNGESATHILGTTSTAGTTQSLFSSPYFLDYDSDTGDLFVADYANHRILVFDGSAAKFAASGSSFNAKNVIGHTNFTTGTSGKTSSTFNSPDEVIVDTNFNRLFVGDALNNRVMIFDISTITNGESAVNVLGQTNFTSSSTAVTASKFRFPRGLAYDSYGQRLFVSAVPQDRILVFNLRVTSNGEDAVNVIGQTDFTSSSSGTTQSKLDGPYDTDYGESSDYFYVMDNVNNRLLIFDAADPYPIPEFSAVMYFVVVLVLGFAIVQKNGGIKVLKGVNV